MTAPRRGLPRGPAAKTLPPAPEAGLRPGLVSVRLIGPPAEVDATTADLAAKYGEAWHPQTRQPSRKNDSHVIQYGQLIMPMPRDGAR